MGTPPLRYSWMKDGVDLNVNKNTLSLSDTDRTTTGNYSCTVSNAFSPTGRPSRNYTSHTALYVVVIERPELTNFPRPSVTAVSSRTVTLSWPAADSQRVFNGNTPITGFSVYCENTVKNQRVPADVAMAANLPSTTLSTTLSGLHPGRSYSCFVMVWNKVGFATTDTATMVTAGEEPPSAAPLQVIFASTTSTSFTLTWMPPPEDSQLGVLTRYRVQYEAVNCGECRCETYGCNNSEVVLVNLLTSPLRLSVTGLRTYTDYNVSIAAGNGAGFGVQAILQRRTLQDRPSPPLNLRIESLPGPALRASWMPPADSNGVLLRYHLRYTPSEGSGGVLEIPISPSPLSALIPNVQRVLVYTVEVQAETSVGIGQADTEVVTAPDAPFIRTNTSQVTIVENTVTATLQCEVLGNPRPTVTWQRTGNTTEVPANNDGSLTLSNVRAGTHAGGYECLARNMWGNDSLTVTVLVVAETSGSDNLIEGFDDTYLFIIIGCVGGLLFILIVFFFVRHHRRKGNFFSTSSNTQPSYYNTNQNGISYNSTAYKRKNELEMTFSNESAVANDQLYNRSRSATDGPTDAPPQTYQPQARVPDSLDRHLRQTGTFREEQHPMRKTVSQIPPPPDNEGMVSSNPYQLPPENLTAEHPYKEVGFPPQGESPVPAYSTVVSHPEDPNTGAQSPVGEHLPTYTARHGDHILTVM